MSKTMKLPTEKQIAAKLRRKSGKTASELGTTVNHLRKLESQGVVTEIGRRQTGKRGRPSVEWGIAA